jgi:hypothetical protein
VRLFENTAPGHREGDPENCNCYTRKHMAYFTKSGRYCG